MQQININQLEYSLLGDGNSNVVFINGFRMNFNSWDRIYKEISRDFKIFLFNRHGVGKSSKATINQSGMVIVNELIELLLKLEIKPPYLLIAHSLGGIYANLFARTYPEYVSGIIFVDAPHPLEIVKQKEFKLPFMLHSINEGVKSIEKLFDKFKYSEDECIQETLYQLDSSASFPNIPIAVVSGSKKMPFIPKELFDIHQSFQKKLLDLSKYSKQYFCKKSGHFPQITDPEILIKVILDTLK